MRPKPGCTTLGPRPRTDAQIGWHAAAGLLRKRRRRAVAARGARLSAGGPRHPLRRCAGRRARIPRRPGQVSYARRARLLNPETAADDIEAGTHGVALVRDREPAVLLLPHVARDEHLGPEGLLGALARKSATARHDLSAAGALYRFERQDVVVRLADSVQSGGRDARRLSFPGRLRAAGAWLASLVDVEGRVTFAVDPRYARTGQALLRRCPHWLAIAAHRQLPLAAGAQREPDRVDCVTVVRTRLTTAATRGHARLLPSGPSRRSPAVRVGW